MWCKHAETGKAMPVDDEAVPNGNVRLNDDGTYSVLGGARLENARSAGEKLHLSHFVTCPQSKRWRR